MTLFCVYLKMYLFENYITLHLMVKQLNDANTSYFKVVKERKWRVWFHMRPDEGIQEGANWWRRVRNSFRFGWQATPSTFQTICPHHCRTWEETQVTFQGFFPVEISWIGITTTWPLKSNIKCSFKIYWFTFFDHSHGKALLEATILASVPPAFVHMAAFGSQTHVLGLFLYRTLHGDRKRFIFFTK